MKKLILVFLFLAITSPAWASDWYIRQDGGTSSQCDGTHDAAQSGAVDSADAGLTPDCAFSHISWLLGSSGTANYMSGGDAVYFRDAGQYPIRYPDMPNIGAGCGAGNATDCVLNPIPGGPDSSHRTKIYGYGWNTGCSGTKTQLWGQNGNYYMLHLQEDHYDIQCLEITDHSACTPNHYGAAVDGVTACSGTYPQGSWASYGIFAESTDDVNITNVDIHGLAAKGIWALHNGDWTLTNTKIISNGHGGWEGDIGPGQDSSYTGTTTLQNNTQINWNGCGERYPLQSSDLNAVSNRHNCSGQPSPGYGDGIGLGDGNPGNWTVTDSQISLNTSDGLDLAHGSGYSNVVKIFRSRMEGNDGNPIKINALTAYIENNFIISNCYFFAGRTFTTTNPLGFYTCRSGGQTLALNMNQANTNYSIIGNTIVGNGDVLINVNGSNCTNGHIYAYNNILLGGRDISGGEVDNVAYYYDDGATGTCTTFDWTENYNIFYDGKDSAHCAGANDQCATDPLFSGTIKQGPLSGVGYYTDTNYATQLYLQSSSPAIGSTKANEAVTCNSNCAIDYNSYARGAQWDVGAVEYGSVTSGQTCGNSIIDSGEACDTLNLNSQTCSTLGLGFVSGTLTCSSCAFNTSGCITASSGGGTTFRGVTMTGATPR